MNMIKVNLLPLHLRVVKKKKKKVAPQVSGATAIRPAGIPLQTILISFGALFFLLTAYFDFNFLMLSKKTKSLAAELALTQPKTQSLKLLDQEVNTSLVPEQSFLNAYVLSKEPITNLLQVMNDSIPEGVWLENFSISNSGKARSFIIKGVAVTIENQTNIEQIESYLQKLKQAIPTSEFTYSTAKLALKQTSATSFSASYKWQVD